MNILDMNEDRINILKNFLYEENLYEEKEFLFDIDKTIFTLTRHYMRLSGTDKTTFVKMYHTSTGNNDADGEAIHLHFI